MNLEELQRHWHAFGERDPLWAILTDPARKGRRWSAEEFFATGIAETAALVAAARAYGLPVHRRRALDFGCGVGRLTQALAAYADEVIGLDVAPSMVGLARDFNRHGGRVRYEVQPAPPFAAIADRSIDLVVTGRVLQHIAPQFACGYVAELARVLAPGGFLSFDLPSRPLAAPALGPGAMPASAYQATLAVTRRPDTRAVIDVVVTNRGAHPWPAGLPINVGNHWLARDGAVLVADDRRAAVPLPLAAGQSTALAFEASWPPPPGAEQVELDVVHEGVTWFGTLGSPTARLPLDALPLRPADQEAGSASTFEPVMEMHAVPREEVEALLAEAGVRPLGVRAETHCGPTWEAWRYDVTADAPG